MKIDTAKRLIKEYIPGHAGFVTKSDVAFRYYKKKNDILITDDNKKKQENTGENPLHNADNRIPSNFYKLQVNQKAAYAFAEPVLFDVGNDDANKLIKKVLGDAFQKKCKALCVQAANTSVGWIHYWKDDKGNFKYAVLDSREIIPVWTKELEKELKAVIRTYHDIEDETGEEYTVYEIWTDEEVQAFRRKTNDEKGDIESYMCYEVINTSSGLAECQDTYPHGFGEVPFIFFNNNDEAENDLNDIKELIDAYDKIYSGFVNDLEDIQEIIFIITNYGGDASDAAGILREMHEKKVVNVESDGADDKSGISTLAIEIPVEAREKMLNITRKAIFEQGMAIDPDPQNFGNSSGVALGYLYSLLELKTGLMETEFRISFNRLIRAILKFHGKTVDNIEQTWTRTSVSNDAELADIAQKSKNVISDETIVRRHPWVDDAEKEILRLKEQKERNEPKWDKAPTIEEGEEDEE